MQVVVVLTNSWHACVCVVGVVDVGVCSQTQVSVWCERECEHASMSVQCCKLEGSLACI